MQPHSRALATLGRGGRSGRPPRNVPSRCFANQVTARESSRIHHARAVETAVWNEPGSITIERERYPSPCKTIGWMARRALGRYARHGRGDVR